MNKTKIVGLLPARNEGNRIAFCLRALAKYTDAIVYLDDCSCDNTIQIVESLASHCNVEKIIRKTEWVRDEPGDRNTLLQSGREIGGTHFVVIDADEAFTSNCMDNNFLRETTLSLQPGDRLAMQWIQLWRSIHRYRFDDSVWTWLSKEIIFCDDGACSYESQFIHTPRVPQNTSGRVFALPGYVHGLLHFQFVNWRNLLLKQAWYRCLERVRDPSKSAEAINQLYKPSSDEKGIRLRRAPNFWLSGYEFFDETAYNEPYLWRETQMLGWFEELGRDFFKDLDVWDIKLGSPQSTTNASPVGTAIPENEADDKMAAAASNLRKCAALFWGPINLSKKRNFLLKSLDYDPNSIDCVMNLARTLSRQGDHAGARWEYLKAARLRPDLVAAYANASAAAARLGLPDEADALLQRALNLVSGKAEKLQLLADARFAEEAYDESAKALFELWRIRPVRIDMVVRALIALACHLRKKIGFPTLCRDGR
jgi:glycosyltransferase involved in cell wall biosynthesis